MQILILYTLQQTKFRKTITEHLYSFRKYSNHSYTYVNVGPKGIPPYLKGMNFDAVILHYTILAGERFLPGELWNSKMRGIEEIQGFKIAIPQDEYCHTGRLVKLFQDISIDAICTCFYKEEDIQLAYAQYLPKHVQYIPVFTGYVDENFVRDINDQILPYSERPIDIGYRASMLPAHIGKHGQLKYELIGVFNDRLKGSDLTLDIASSNHTLTSENRKTVKLGDEWHTFLLNCKAFIGCEGGSSLLDFDGTIQDKVYAYCATHPEATFNEIEAQCFPGMDNSISLFAISPRHFEAASTKTLQILVEGYYGGIFQPEVHYLSLKKDYSNFNEVINCLRDTELCQRIIDQAYDDVVLSGKHTYLGFVNKVLSLVPITKTKGSRNLLTFAFNVLILRIREILLPIRFFLIEFYHGPFFDAVYPYYRKYFRHFIRGRNFKDIEKPGV